MVEEETGSLRERFTEGASVVETGGADEKERGGAGVVVENEEEEEEEEGTGNLGGRSTERVGVVEMGKTDG